MPTPLLRSRAERAIEPAPGYLASEIHYASVAGRIHAALRGATSAVVVVGDPPAEPQPLSEALGKLAGPRQTVIRIACGPDLALREELSRVGGVIVRRTADGGAAASDAAEIGSPLFVFEQADRLSDQQIEEICATTRRAAAQNTTGVLLAGLEFLGRLEQPPLQPLKGAFAHLKFDEIADDEAIDFLRHQLVFRQSQEEESRARPIFFRGLAVSGVLAAVIIGASLVLHYGRAPGGGEATAEHSGPPAGYASLAVATQPAPAPPAAPFGVGLPAAPEPSKPAAVAVPAAPTPSRLETARGAARGPARAQPPDAGAPQDPPRPPQPASVQRLSAEEMTALMARGDKFLSAGDIASARLFYERAADAGNGAAAFRLGATFDPNFLGRVGVLGTPGDPNQATTWYRRALDLGDAAAAERLKALTR